MSSRPVKSGLACKVTQKNLIRMTQPECKVRYDGKAHKIQG